jgi:hypothetical protein
MNRDECELLLEMAGKLLAAGHGDQLAAEIAESGMAAELWSDAESLGSLFELHGSLCASSPLPDLAVLRPDDASQPVRLLLPVPGSAAPPGLVVGSEIVVDGVALSPPDTAALVVGADSGDVLQVRGADIQDVRGLDPELGLVRVRATVTLDDCQPAYALPHWSVLEARAARVLAHELLGVAAAARTIAVRHVQERHQFGRPIAAFQAVRHRLADALIAETGAREVVAAAGEPLDFVTERLIVKAVAGRAALLNVQAAQQVCGAMGFTAEFGLHRLVRRAYVLDALLTGSEDAEEHLAATALATGMWPGVPVAL